MLGVLVQIDGYDPVAAAAVTLRAASLDHEDICGLNGETWFPAIATLPALRYDFFTGAFAGFLTTPASSLDLATAVWPNFSRYNLADARIRIYTGQVGDVWGSWTLRFDGRVADSPPNDGDRASISFAVEDRWLDAPLLDTYAGTTGAEGEAAQKGQVKPLAIGAPRYVPAKLINSVDTILHLSAYGAIQAVDSALENLNLFSASDADYADYAALAAATIAPGKWATCLAEGFVRHGAPPVNGAKLTYQMSGDNSGPDGWARLPGDVMRRIALLSGGTGKINDASFDALNSSRPYNLSLFLDRQTTARALLQEIAASVNATVGVSWTGELFVLPVEIGGAADLNLASDGSSLPAVASAEEISNAAPFWRLAIEAERTWGVHSLSEVHFSAPLIDLGLYDAAVTYREGNIVSRTDGSSWVYVNVTPTSGNAPAENAYWDMLSGPTDFSAIGQTSLWINTEFDLLAADGRPAGVLAGYSTSDPLDIAVSPLGGLRIEDLGGTDSSIGAYLYAIPVNDLTTYNIALSYIAAAAQAGGFYLRVCELAGELPTDAKIIEHVNDSESGDANAPTADTVFDLIGNGPVAITATPGNFTYTPTSGTKWVSFLFLKAGAIGADEWLDITRFTMRDNATVNGFFSAPDTSIPTALAVNDQWYNETNDHWYVAESAGADAIAAGEWVIRRPQFAIEGSGSNRVANPYFASERVDGTIAEWFAVETANDEDFFHDADGIATIDSQSGDSSIGFTSAAIPVTPGQTFRVGCLVNCATAPASGFYLRVEESNDEQLPTGKRAVGSPASSKVHLRDDFENIAGNAALIADENYFAEDYTVPDGVYNVSLTFLNWSGIGDNPIQPDHVFFRDKSDETILSQLSISGPSTITISRDSGGVPKSVQFDITKQFTAKIGDTDVTEETETAFAVSNKAGLTESIDVGGSGAGLLTLSAATIALTAGPLVITATYTKAGGAALSKSLNCAILLDTDAVIVSGTSDSDFDTLSNPAGNTSYINLSAVMNVTVGSSGNVLLHAIATYPFFGSPDTSRLRWQYSANGTSGWTTISTGAVGSPGSLGLPPTEPASDGTCYDDDTDVRTAGAEAYYRVQGLVSGGTCPAFNGTASVTTGS